MWRFQFLFISVSLLSFNFLGYTQKDIKADTLIRPLQAGDQMPDYTFKNLINYPSKSARVSDFKGKLLILDFWSTYCVSCIESFPKLIKLQETFRDKIQIILVNTTQDENLVKNLFEKRRQLSNISVTLPTVCGDSVLGMGYFRHEGEPHVAWINGDGKVLSITGGDALKADVINSFLKGEKLNLPQKIEFAIDYDFRKPLFVNNNGGNGDQVMWQSVLARRVPGLPYSNLVMADSVNGYHICALNHSISEMYRFVYSDRLRMADQSLEVIQPNRTIMEVKDTTKYVSRVNEMFVPDNTFTYKLTSPPTTKDSLKILMKQDLNRYFGLKVRMEKRKVSCLVLSASDTSMIKYRSGDNRFYISDYEVGLNNVTLADFIRYLEYTTGYYYYLPYPIIDETGFKGKLGNINFRTKIYDYESLDKALRRYGMKLTLAVREIDMLVLTEPGF